jgi:hypothetical protein
MNTPNKFIFNNTSNNSIIETTLYDNNYIICKINFIDSNDVFSAKIINSDIKFNSVNKFFTMIKNAFESKPDYSFEFTFMEDNNLNVFITFSYSNELIDLQETIIFTKESNDEKTKLENKIKILESQLESQKIYYENKIQELEQQNNLVQNIQLQKRINDEQYITNLNRINELEEKLKVKELELNNKENMYNEMFILEERKKVLEQKEIELNKKELMMEKTLNNTLLPKVCEKSECIEIIREYCQKMYNQRQSCSFKEENLLIAEKKINDFLSDNSEYVVHKTHLCFITNKGRIFFKYSHINQSGEPIGYINLNLKHIDKPLLRILASILNRPNGEDPIIFKSTNPLGNNKNEIRAEYELYKYIANFLI